MDKKTTFIRKILPELADPKDAKAKIEALKQAQSRKLYRAEMLHVAKTILNIVTTLDVYSLGLATQAETLTKYRIDAAQLIQVANSLQELGQTLQQEAAKIEKKSKFPPQ